MARNKNRKINFHSFYCINCGKSSLSLPRSAGQLREQFHRKKMYCFNCKAEINHIECRDEAEVYEFKCAFEEGEYVNEAKESMAFIGNTGLRQIDLGAEANC